MALTRADRHADALVVAEEAVAIWRILAEDPHERLYLATALDMLTADLGEQERGLEVAAEAGRLARTIPALSEAGRLLREDRP